MSWSIQVRGTAANIRQRVQLAEVPYVDETVGPETNDQLLEAKRSADLILTGASVGSYPCFSVSMSGHANPNHEPKDGFADDFVSVSVVGISQRIVDAYWKPEDFDDVAGEVT